MKPAIGSDRRIASILGVDTAYWREGRGPTVVLLHGGAPGACSDVNWHTNFDYLVEHGFDVITYDQPGFGHSSLPEDHSIDFRYRHAVAFLRQTGAKSVFLVGNSIGGLLSVLMYSRKHELGFSIEGLVLAAPFPHFPISEVAKKKYEPHRARLAAVQPTFESVQALCHNTFFSAAKVSEELVRLRLSMIEGRNWTALLGRRAAGNAFEARGVDQKRIAARSLVIWGLNDRSIPAEVGLEAIRHFSNAQFLFLPECGHWPQTEQSDAFNRAVLAFLSAPPATGPEAYSGAIGSPGEHTA